MISEIFYIIPSIVCLVWVGIFSLRKRSYTNRITLQMLVISAIYFFLYIFLFTPGIEYSYVCRADVLAIPLILALLASLAIFVNSLPEKKWISTAKMQWLYMPAIAEGSIVGVFYHLIGLDKVTRFFYLCDEIKKTHPEEYLFRFLPEEFTESNYELFYFFDVTLFNIACTVMFLVVIVVCCMAIRNDGYKFGDYISFLFRGKEITAAKFVSLLVILLLLTVSPLVIIGRTYVMQHAWLGITISIIVSVEIFVMSHIELINNLKSFTLYDFTHVDTHVDADDDTEEKLMAVTPMLSERAIQKTVALTDKLRDAIEQDKVWLDAELRLSSLADALGTNRNKLSVLFNQLYGKDFKAFVAEQRIAEAQRLMKENTSVTLEWVALHCGFKDASSFSHRFKDIVGVSPTEWRLGNN